MKNVSRRMFLSGAAAAAAIAVLPAFPAFPERKIVSMLSKIHMPGIFSPEPWIVDVTLIADYPAQEFRVQLQNDKGHVETTAIFELKDIQKAMKPDVFAVHTSLQVNHHNGEKEKPEVILAQKSPGPYGGDFMIWDTHLKDYGKVWLKTRDIGIVLAV